MIINQTIRDALTEIGVLSPLDEPQPQESQHALRTLNRIIDSYNTQNLTVTQKKDIVLKLADMTVDNSWKSCIVIGSKDPNADFTQVPPIEIDTLFFRQDEVDYIAKPMTALMYSAIGFKNVQAIPTQYYTQTIGRNSLQLCFNQIPLNTLEIHIKGTFPYDDSYDVMQDIEWGFGFEKALMLRLAYELSSSYGVEPSPNLMGRMLEAENNLKASNYTPETLKADAGLFGRRRFRNRNRAMY